MVAAVTLLHLLDGGAWCKRVRGNDPADETVLIVVSYDAFRTEYLRRGSASYMAELGHNGTWAEYLRNVFPTKTFPNHHSIATGVFPNQHGVMANGLYDHGRGKINYSYDLFHFNEELVPIWVGGRASGRVSASYQRLLSLLKLISASLGGETAESRDTLVFLFLWDVSESNTLLRCTRLMTICDHCS